MEKNKILGQKAMVCPPIGKATGIKSWPEDDRPREKLLKKDTHVLSNSELLAVHKKRERIDVFLVQPIIR